MLAQDQLLQLLALSLDAHGLEPDKVTPDFLEGVGKTQIGWEAMSLMKLAVLRKVSEILRSLEGQDWAARTADLIEDVGALRKALAAKAKAESMSMKDDGLWASVFASEETPTPSNAVEVVSYVVSVVSGALDGDFQEMSSCDDLMTKFASMEGDSPIIKDWREAVGRMDGSGNKTAQSMISAGEGNEALADAPLSMIMSQVAPGRDLEELRDEARRERAEVLAKARGVRKGICNLAAQPTSVSQASLQAAVQRMGFGDVFRGKLNESHRGFFLMAELEHEGKQGWTGPSTVSGAGKTSLQAKMDYLKSLSGPHDFVFVADGRSRGNRAIIDEKFRDIPETNWTELWVSYSGSCVRSSTRQVFAGQLNKEVVYVKLPASRVRIAAGDRGESRLFNPIFHTGHI